MDSNTILAVAVAAVVVAAGLLTLTTTRRRDRMSATGLSRETRKRDRSAAVGGAAALQEESAPTGREVERAAMLERRGSDIVLAPSVPAPAVPKAPMDPETYGITRRKFFNRSIIALFTAGLGGFGAACLAFIWPTLSGGFGTKIKVGKLEDILSEINDTKKPKYVPEGRFYLNPYPKGAVKKAKDVYAGGVLTGMESGVVALYQRCPHLGCRVPWCETSQWFECPCHGSQYNRVGEKKAGPAPRGLDRFGVEVTGGTVSVDTKLLIQGPVIGTNTTGQEAEGPHCVSGGH